jgi:PKD repeat protein
VGDANYNPDAVIDAEPWVGQPGVEVQFSAARSTDRDNGDLFYEWDFNNDGTTDSNEISPSYTYFNAGVYPVKLTVSDGNGGKGTFTVQIAVGSDPPKPVITSHQGDATFAVGDAITLTGYVTDINGDTLPDESLEWEVRQHHGTHFHPYLVPTKGNNIEVLPAPAPEDYFAATNS